MGDRSSIAAPVTGLLLLGGMLIFTFGVAVAVTRRANSEYKKAKAGLPGMRKDFWQSLWRAIKVGFWIAVAFVALVMWTVHDARDSPAPAGTPVPTGSTR